MSGESLLVILVVGFIAGWLASQVVQGTGFGLIGDRTAGGTVMRDLFEHDDGGWLQDPALLDRLVIKELQAKAEIVRSEGWTRRWSALLPGPLSGDPGDEGGACNTFTQFLH